MGTFIENSSAPHQKSLRSTNMHFTGLGMMTLPYFFPDCSFTTGSWTFQYTSKSGTFHIMQLNRSLADLFKHHSASPGKSCALFRSAAPAFGIVPTMQWSARWENQENNVHSLRQGESLPVLSSESKVFSYHSPQRKKQEDKGKGIVNKKEGRKKGHPFPFCPITFAFELRLNNKITYKGVPIRLIPNSSGESSQEYLSNNALHPRRRNN